MQKKIKSGIFYLLILAQLQLDLLLFNYSLQGLIAILFGLFIYRKKKDTLRIFFTTGLILIARFITNQCFLFFDLGLILISFLCSKILKRNLTSRILSYYLILICYLLASNYLINLYIFSINLNLVNLANILTLNLLYGLLVIFVLTKKFNSGIIKRN